MARRRKKKQPTKAQRLERRLAAVEWALVQLRLERGPGLPSLCSSCSVRWRPKPGWKWHVRTAPVVIYGTLNPGGGEPAPIDPPPHTDDDAPPPEPTLERFEEER